MNRDKGTRPVLTDDDRTSAIDELRWHHASDRIDEDELARRVARVARAESRADLAALFADLPRHPTVPPGTAYADRIQRAKQRRRAGWRVVGIAFAIAAAFFFAVGFSVQGWAWAWVLFVIPVVAIVVQRENLTAKPAQARVVT